MPVIIDTFESFVREASDYVSDKPKDWRVGQTVFNLLSVVRPDIAEMVRGSDYDPFYNDAKLALFYDFVMRHW